jgi:hypothetical protein
MPFVGGDKPPSFSKSALCSSFQAIAPISIGGFLLGGNSGLAQICEGGYRQIRISIGCQLSGMRTPCSVAASVITFGAGSKNTF